MNGNERVVPQPVPDLPSAVPDLPSTVPDLPSAVPDLPSAVPGLPPAASGGGVTDGDRNRFGAFLDHAAERGLLSPAEYQVRLAELADATSIDQLQRIVTELPVFGGPGAPSGPVAAPAVHSAAVGPAAADGSGLDAALWAGRTPAATRRGRNNPWLVLIIMVAVLLVALVVLALVASHVAHAHNGGAPGTGLPAAPGLSFLRL